MNFSYLSTNKGGLKDNTPSTAPPSTAAPSSTVGSGNKEVKGKTHTYYQVIQQKVVYNPQNCSRYNHQNYSYHLWSLITYTFFNKGAERWKRWSIRYASCTNRKCHIFRQSNWEHEKFVCHSWARLRCTWRYVAK